MFEKLKKHQPLLMAGLIVLCMGLILAGGTGYLGRLQTSLMDNAVQNVINATHQQRQSFDDFISTDQKRLSGYADYFSMHDHGTPEELRQLLAMFKGMDAECLVLCLDEGWVCGSMHSEILQLDETTLAAYRALPESGARDNYTGLFSGTPKFSYYQTFTFRSGHKGLIQNSYDRSKMMDTFTLSLYDGRGYGYILDQQGDILLRSVSVSGSRVYSNIFDALTDTHSRPEEITRLAEALEARESGSHIFYGDAGRFIYTYAPLESIEGWYMLSIVPMDAISAETDAILRDSQVAVELLIAILFACLLVGALIRRTHRTLQAKDKEIAYQEQLFDIFSTHLSRNTNDVYMLLDRDTQRVEYISPNAERVMGLNAETLVAHIRAEDLAADPDGTQVYYTQVQGLKPNGAPSTRSAERTDPRTGERKYFLETIYCIDLQGQSKWVSYISDRTRERRVQDSLTEALQMAKAANEAKTAFLSSVSHDIRTPMNAILGFLSLMEDELSNPDITKAYIQRIKAASQHLLGLINDVLDMNKIESGSTTLSIAEMDMAEVVEGLNTIIRPQARLKGQTFDIFASRLKHEYLWGDKIRINQILINLLSNAVKYTPEGGRIELRIEELPQSADRYSRIRFTVRDNGLGMSEDYQKVIFDPFTREETKVTHEIQGTGLGMAITKSLVDLMGGDIRLKSAPGRGSTFTVELDLRIQEQEDDPSFWTDHKIAKMLVVNRDEEACRGIAGIMSRVGVAADCAASGEDALQMMQEHCGPGQAYDLILLDWQLPDMSGLEAARLIRKNYPDKILLLTACDWSEIEEEAVELGISHFMPKPFFLSTFQEAVCRVMGSGQTERRSPAEIIQGRHILVVDDIEVNRVILVKILGSLGASCDTAANGQEAVELFEQSRPGDYDLILMDVQMPVMGGYEATRAIRSGSHPNAKDIPIIAMTANAFADDVRDAIEAGMDAHIAKPVQLDALKSTIRQVLDNRRSPQA